MPMMSTPGRPPSLPLRVLQGHKGRRRRRRRRRMHRESMDCHVARDAAIVPSSSPPPPSSSSQHNRLSRFKRLRGAIEAASDRKEGS